MIPLTVATMLLTAALRPGGAEQQHVATGWQATGTVSKPAWRFGERRSTELNRSARGTRLFARGSFWNRRLAPAARLDPSSAALVYALAAEVQRELTAGIWPWIATGDGSTPLYRVGRRQARVPVRLERRHLHGGEALQRAFASVPIPRDAQPAAGADRHMTVWQPSKDSLWEFFGASRDPDGWHTLWGGAIRRVSKSRGYYGRRAWPGATSNWGATASSLPVIGGTMLLAELNAGRIGHALRDQRAGGTWGRVHMARTAHRWHWSGDGAARGSAPAPGPGLEDREAATAQADAHDRRGGTALRHGRAGPDAPRNLALRRGPIAVPSGRVLEALPGQDSGPTARPLPMEPASGARDALVQPASVPPPLISPTYTPRVLSSQRRNQGSGDVTVVIPSRDRWQLLRTALASALAQRNVEVDVVVADDGSIDRTPNELRKLGDERVRVVRLEPSKGVSAARNLGLVHVRAPWVAFLDDDDVWAPGHLAAMLDAVRDSGLERERVGLVFSGHLDLDADRHVTDLSPAVPADSIHAGLQRMNVVGCPSRVLLRTEAVRAVGGFDAQLSILADWDLWVRVVAGNEVVRCPELLVGYMHHAGNMHLDAERFLAELATLREKHGWSRRGSRDAVFGDLLPSYLAATYRTRGRRFTAALWYSRAFRARHDPRDLGRIAGVLLGERLIELSRLGRSTNVDPSLGRWLEDVRRAERAPTTGLAPPPGLYSDTAAT